jgi:hypothetical protein
MDGSTSTDFNSFKRSRLASDQDIAAAKISVHYLALVQEFEPQRSLEQEHPRQSLFCPTRRELFVQRPVARVFADEELQSPVATCSILLRGVRMSELAPQMNLIRERGGRCIQHKEIDDDLGVKSLGKVVASYVRLVHKFQQLNLERRNQPAVRTS